MDYNYHVRSSADSLCQIKQKSDRCSARKYV